MDRKIYAIGILIVTATMLLIANLIPLPQAVAATTIRDRDYQVVTARVQQGGEGLYVLDNRTGMIAIFTWDVAARAVKLRAVRPIADAFRD
jgi:hypothetical protein